MNKPPVLDDNKKLKVTYRVEAGCLGPDGLNYIVDFCEFTQTKLKTFNSHFIIWNIIHRADKTLPEMEFGLANKSMSDSKADKYLSAFGINLDDFEENLTEHLATLISQFMSKIEGSGH